MSRVNIDGSKDNNDSHYRYKRYKIKIEEQKGKTVIINLEKIADDYPIDCSILVTYIKKKLGIGIVNKKGNHICSNKSTVNKLEKCLKDFEEEFVKCNKCSLPETDLSLDTTGDLVSKCKCCSNVHTYKYSATVDIVIKYLKKNKKSKKNKKK